MVEKFVIHLGIHKTATTSTQRFLDNNRHLLKSAGAAFIPLKQMRENVTPLIRTMTKAGRASLAKLIAKTEQPVILWSDETILGWTHDIKAGTLYRYGELRAAQFCTEYPDVRFEFVLALRSPSAYLASMYCEFIKHSPFEGFESYVDTFDYKRFSFRNIFDWLYDLPENASTTIIPFEKKYGGGPERVVETLIEAACDGPVEIDISKLSEIRARVSFSAEEIALASDISAQAGPAAALNFLQIINTKGFRFGETRFSPLADQADILEQTYLDDLRYFAARQPEKVSLLAPTLDVLG